MQSGSWASYVAAAPPEMFGEPDDDRPTGRMHCEGCGAFISYKTATDGVAEREGWVVEWWEWSCRKCGRDLGSGDHIRGKVYGPVPPWAYPHMFKNAEGEWVDWLAPTAAEWDENEAAAALANASHYDAEPDYCFPEGTWTADDLPF